MTTELTIDSSQFRLLNASNSLPDVLIESTKFYFKENIHHEQRRCGKCDIFGPLCSERYIAPENNKGRI